MNRSIDPVTTQRLEMQGFVGYREETLRAIRPWLRLGPALCGAGMVAAIVLQSTTILWTLVAVALLGAILPVHPFDIPYNCVIRRRAGTPAIPSYGLPRRFACMLAAKWISLTAIALGAGQHGIALGLAGVFVLSPIINVTTDFCVGSWIYHRLTGVTRAVLPKRRTSTRDRASGFAGLH